MFMLSKRVLETQHLDSRAIGASTELTLCLLRWACDAPDMAGQIETIAVTFDDGLHMNPRERLQSHLIPIPELANAGYEGRLASRRRGRPMRQPFDPGRQTSPLIPYVLGSLPIGPRSAGASFMNCVFAFRKPLTFYRLRGEPTRRGLRAGALLGTLAWRVTGRQKLVTEAPARLSIHQTGFLFDALPAKVGAALPCLLNAEGEALSSCR